MVYLIRSTDASIWFGSSMFGYMYTACGGLRLEKRAGGDAADRQAHCPLHEHGQH
jgi:hypothetical protein